MIKTKEEASKYACQILRTHFVGLNHPNINAYDDDYIIRNYPYEYKLFMEGYNFAYNNLI